MQRLLIRWQDDKYGFVSPDRFIPFIEQNACIFELGNWVIWQALQDATEIRRIIPDFIINVNIAAPQLERPDFHYEVLNALHDTGYPPQNLLSGTDGAVQGTGYQLFAQ